MLDPRHIQALKAWDLDDWIPDRCFAQMFADPGFPLACREISARMIAAAAGDVMFDGMVKDAGRYVAAIWAAYLHVTDSLTLPHLKELCAASGLLSPGRARAMLLYLQFLGYVRPAPSTRGEARRYVATPALMQALRRQIQAGLEAASLIEPAAAALSAEMEDPDLLNAFIRHQGEGFIAAVPQYDTEAPIFRLLYHRHAGMQLLHLILLAAPNDQRFPPRGAATISVAAVARQLRVSRAHIMRMLGDAEQFGLLVREADGSFRIDEAAGLNVKHYFATRLMGFLICGAKAVLHAGWRPSLDGQFAFPPSRRTSPGPEEPRAH